MSVLREEFYYPNHRLFRMIESQNSFQSPLLEPIRVVIIDDHRNIRELVGLYLARYYEGVTKVVGQADRVKSAIELLQTTETDIIFLDIDLNDGTGFEALDTLSPEQRERLVVIIISMERERKFMKQALQYGALDYLDKPLVANEFKIAVDKAIDEIMKIRQISEQLHQQPAPQSASSSTSQKRPLPQKQDSIIEVRILRQNQVKTHRIPVRDIVYAQAARNYCLIVTADGTNLMPSLPLKHFQDALLGDGCVRIARGTIVNPVHIQFQFRSNRESIVALLPNGEEIVAEEPFRDVLHEYV
ncbi:MAG: response regulator [Candidatus Kapabacteria bacterium]|jgi:two-component system LytT family response regulator|nr:response regulator [Candidatus Kapabacteria bacterium]